MGKRYPRYKVIKKRWLVRYIPFDKKPFYSSGEYSRTLLVILECGHEVFIDDWNYEDYKKTKTIRCIKCESEGKIGNEKGTARNVTEAIND